MALFKILKGKSTSLPSVQNTEGYAYFTPDDGKFYIDVEKAETDDPIIIGNHIGEKIQQSDGSYKTPNRICINQKIFTYNDYDILDCGNASEEIDDETTQKIVFNCGSSFI